MTWYRLIILTTTLAYIAGFAGYYFLTGNSEFIWYIAVMLGFVLFITATIKQTRFSPAMLWALSLWGFLHMAGGGVVVNGNVLYAFVFWPIVVNGDFALLKFDQFVHFYGFAVATVAMFYLLKPFARRGATDGRVLLLAVLAGMGLGALNEIVEFIAVVTFPHTNVGGYFNTGLDLVFNMGGAVVAAGLLFVRDKLPERLKFTVREPEWLGREVKEGLKKKVKGARKAS